MLVERSSFREGKSGYPDLVRVYGLLLGDSFFFAIRFELVYIFMKTYVGVDEQELCIRSGAFGVAMD